MATHSSILAWRIPWTEEPGRLQSMGSQSQTQLNRLSMLAFNPVKCDLGESLRQQVLFLFIYYVFYLISVFGCATLRVGS